MKTVYTMADGGSIRIYTNNLAVQFSAGSGDGRYQVNICEKDDQFEQSGEGWVFVDNFTVTDPGVFLSHYDCENGDPLFAFPVGRWFIYHKKDENLVVIQQV